MATEARYFGVWDYVVFAVMLCISAGIGLFYACTGGKQRTQKEFLMADKSMSIVPVTMSLLASFISAITVLGTPAEVYNNGTMFWNFAVADSLAMVVVARLFVPTFYNMGLTSTYELVYMGLVLYTPSLALNAVTGLTLWGAVAAVGVVCTFYTTLGGMKAVMWTDTFQVVVMVAGFLAVIIQGTIEVGGPARVWEINGQGERLEFFNFDPDPRIRHSSWGIYIGGIFIWASIYGVNQAQVQRYLSCPSVKQAQTEFYSRADL
ncbi:Sodium-coupled monocarboxylate transporter 1 [Branchiostoma belcheri]|nr:Sodium-coupled monocarboxylate transporter 1 [Branchiostoma belcheri]